MYDTFTAWNGAMRDPEGIPATSGPGREAAGDGAPLAGTWRLRAGTRSDPAGRVTVLYARDRAGAPAYYVAYRGDGTLRLVSARPRPPAACPLDLVGPRGLLVEATDAGDVLLAACGAYVLRAGTLVHRLDGCSFPAWLGLDREQAVELARGALLWTAAGWDAGRPETTRLHWERA